MLISWVSLGRWVLIASTIILMLVTVLTRSNGALLATGVSAGLLLLCALVFFIEYPSVRCLMCGANLLRRLGCSPHGDAKRILGDHTLRATLRLASYPDFITCPYCNGRFRLAGKSRRGDDVDRKSEWPEEDPRKKRRRVRR